MMKSFCFATLCVVALAFVCLSEAAVPNIQTNCNNYNYLGGPLRKLVQVSKDIDDVEQLVCNCNDNGKVKCTDSSDLELVTDDEREGGGVQKVGIRFRNLPSTNGLLSSTMCFTVEDEDEKAFTSLKIQAIRQANTVNLDLCARNSLNTQLTTAFVQVAISEIWQPVGKIKCFQTNLNPIFEELVTLPGAGTLEGKAVTFVISGYGNREVYSYHGNYCKAPVLLLDYTPPTCGCQNAPGFTCPADGGYFTKCPVNDPYNENAALSKFCFCGEAINADYTLSKPCLAARPDCNGITECTSANDCKIGETCQKRSCCTGRKNICNKICSAGFPYAPKAQACAPPPYTP